jgi:flagellar hook assembly protein FlgD
MTTIRFDLPRDGHATLDIHDAAGRLVVRLLDGMQVAGPGSARWDGRDERGERLSSGVYYYRLRQGSAVSVRKMVLAQ